MRLKTKPYQITAIIRCLNRFSSFGINNVIDKLLLIFLLAKADAIILISRVSHRFSNVSRELCRTPPLYSLINCYVFTKIGSVMDQNKDAITGRQSIRTTINFFIVNYLFNGG